MKKLNDEMRLSLALELWRGLMSGADEADILSALVSRLNDARPGILAHIFFGCREDGAARFTFIGTDAAEALKVDNRHGDTALGHHLDILDSVILESHRRCNAACLRGQGDNGGLSILILPTGPDTNGASGFLGLCAPAPAASADGPARIEYFAPNSDVQTCENGNVMPLRAAG